jgi:hypothetical protein
MEQKSSRQISTIVTLTDPLVNGKEELACNGLNLHIGKPISCYII